MEFRLQSKPNRQISTSANGFTLVELLVVIAIIGVLVALLLPSVQAAREAARRAQCQNNLKQVGLSLQNYHSSLEEFPIGSPRNESSSGYGFSWWFSILPYSEETNLFDRVDTKGSAYVGPESYGGVLYQYEFPMGWCPSSPMPKFTWSPDDPYRFAPTYTGVSGSADSRIKGVVRDQIGAAMGFVTANGVLVGMHAITISQITDGTSNTIAIGEQSDWCFDSETGEFADCRSESLHGFQMGCGGPVTSNPVFGELCHRAYNTTGVTQRINEKTWNAVGVGQFRGSDGTSNWGANRPIQSAHPGGAHVGMADGSVQFLEEDIDFPVFSNMCGRDDGRMGGEEPIFVPVGR